MVSGPPFYLWEVPGKPISIQLPFDVIDRMSPDILRGFGALKRRGAEVGGILLGRSEEGPRRKVIIEDFIPVPSEYLTGPSYNLSENDLSSFEAALAQPSSSESGIVPVGFYRSHTRDELFMDDADLSLASRYFPDPESVFLLIRPFASRPSVGGFFFWEDGEINRESSYLQFPFHRKELGGGETPRLAEPPPRVHSQTHSLPPYTPAGEPALVPLAPAEHLRQVARRQTLSILDADVAPPPIRSRWGWLAPLFLVAAGAVGFFAYQNLESFKAADKKATDTKVPDVKAADTPAVHETTLPLRLSVAENQNQLEVTWDRNALAVVRAKRGVLTITDGSNRRDLELSGAQLRNGRVLYSRLSADVNLRLEVFPEGQASVSESIRVVSTDLPKPPELQPPVTPAAEQPAPRKAEKHAPRKRDPISHRPAPARAPQPPVQEPPASPAEVELQRPSVRR